MADKELYQLAIKHYGSWDNAKSVLKLKRSDSTDNEILKRFKKAYKNKETEVKHWRIQCKYAIDRFGTLENAYKKAKIKREHLDEETFLINFKETYSNRKKGSEEYSHWRLYSQKATTKNKSIAVAYEKAGIKKG